MSTDPTSIRVWMDLDENLEAPAQIEEQGEALGLEGEPGSGPVKLGRRGFLQILGVGSAASLAACKRIPAQHAIPFLVPPEDVVPGVPVRYASTCGACPAACGLMVTVRDGRPVKLEGHPEHPLSKGGLCALGQGDLRALYDADRLRHPKVDGATATWRQVDDAVRQGLGAAGGRGVWVLSSSVVSPTARKAMEAFVSRNRGRWVEYDADAGVPAAVTDAYAALGGEARVPALDLMRTDLLVSFGADLLGTGAEPVAHTRAYADRRRLARTRGTLRHLQIEGSLSLTGAAADERWQGTAAERRQLVLWTLRKVAEARRDTEIVQALSGLSPAEGLAARSDDLAKALLDKGRWALVVSGADDLVEQVAVASLNRLLGSEGHALRVDRPARSRRGTGAGLAELEAALSRGEVRALFVFGIDPVDQLPDGGAFGEAMAKLPLSVAVTDRPNATTRQAKVVAAAHHPLECWADALPRDEILTLAQPAIRPLFATRPPFENLLHWTGASETDWRRYLMESWRSHVFAGLPSPAFEAAWFAAVSRGGAPSGSTFQNDRRAGEGGEGHRNRPPAMVLRAALADAIPTPETELEVELIAEVGLRDGTRAHVPWLRELPDPLTRSSWVPTVRVAPALAKAQGLEDGAVVEVVAEGGGRVTMPVRVMPGQHPKVLGIPVGYGRADGGDGGKASTNAWRLADAGGSARRRAGIPARLVATGTRETLPLIQLHPSTEGRPILHQVRHPDEKVRGPKFPTDSRLWEARETPRRYEMVIDLDACTGCSACVVSCQVENNIPVVGPDEMARRRDMHWLRMDRYFSGDADDPDVLFQPMMCPQCGDAPCENVCPVIATVRSHDGLNQQVYNRCVGTRYCANNCPYKVRRFNWFDYDHGTPLERMVLNPDVTVRSRGVMEKCTFCVQRIQLSRIEAKADGREAFEPMTACQQSCPAQAISFADAAAEGSEVEGLKDSPRAFQALAELGVRPQVTYLARVRNPKGTATGEEGA